MSAADVLGAGPSQAATEFHRAATAYAAFRFLCWAGGRGSGCDVTERAHWDNLHRIAAGIIAAGCSDATR